VISGKYAITMKTALGPKRGTLTLSSEGDRLSGLLEIMGQKNERSNGRIIGNVCEFTGEIKTLMGKISFVVRGTIEDGKLNAIAETKSGKMEINGMQIQNA